MNQDLRVWIVVALGVCALLRPPAAGAQVPSKVTRPVAECTDIGTNIDPADLAETAASGEWVKLSGELIALRAQLDGMNCLASGDERIIVVFPGKDGLGERILYSIVFPSEEPFSAVLPGLTGQDAKVPQLYEVFLADRPRASLLSNYVATKQDNPATAQAIAALSANLGTLLTLAGGIAGAPIKALMAPNVNTVESFSVEKAKGPPPPKSFASVAHVSLSAARAKVEVARRASIPQTRAEIVKSINQLTLDVRMREARDNQAALAYADDMEEIVDKALKACEEKQLELIADVLADPQNASPASRRAALDKAVVDCRTFVATAAASRLLAVPTADRDAVADTNERYRNHIADLGPAKIDQKATLVNEPKQRMNIGAMTAFIAAASQKTRVKADGGKIVSDPLPRVLTAVGVDWSFRAYQPSVPRTMKNGLGGFVGATLTPNLGLAGAFTWRIVNGLLLTAGGALLAVPTGTIDDKAPSAGTPFVTTGMRAGFVGMVFNLK